MPPDGAGEVAPPQAQQPPQSPATQPPPASPATQPPPASPATQHRPAPAQPDQGRVAQGPVSPSPQASQAQSQAPQAPQAPSTQGWATPPPSRQPAPRAPRWESAPPGPRHGRADEPGLPDESEPAGEPEEGEGTDGQGQSDQPRSGESSFADEDDLFESLEPRAVPRSGARALLFRTTKLNLGPGKKDREDRDIRNRLNRQLRRTRGYCGYVGIASEKGGVGKTTLAALLATEVSEGRRESVGVADLNPDLGTLPDRFGIRPHHSIRDLLAHVDEIPWRYHVHDFMDKVPEMNVRVLAASTDRKIRHQLTIAEVELLAEMFAPFFSFAILDNGTHITHAAMLGTLKVAHGLVLVTDNTKDGANLARKTLEFLTDNGYPDMRRRVTLAVVAKEVASPVKTKAIEKAFRDHVRQLVIVPYDPALDGGGKIPFHDPNAMNKLLKPQTRAAVRRLAAIVIDDLVT